MLLENRARAFLANKQDKVCLITKESTNNLLIILLFTDLQNVSITLRILHRPEPSKLPNIYLNIGRDYADRVLPSIVNEVLKAVVVRYIY